MTTLSGHVNEPFRASVPASVAAAHFASLEAIARNYRDLDRSEPLGDSQMKVWLKPIQQLGKTYRGRYIGEWLLDGTTVTWRTLPDDHNMRSEGTASFRDAAGGCTFTYEHTIEIDIEVPYLIGKALKPIVGKLIRDGIRRYVASMVDEIERTA